MHSSNNEHVNTKSDRHEDFNFSATWSLIHKIVLHKHQNTKQLNDACPSPIVGHIFKANCH